MDAIAYAEFEKISEEMAAVKKRVRKVVRDGRKADHAEILDLTEICEGHVQRLEELERRLDAADADCASSDDA